MDKILRKTKSKGFLGLLVGMALALFQTGESPAAMIEDEGTGDRHIAKKMIGGIVVKVRHLRGTRNISLLIRETKIDRTGRPLCNAPTGRILSVESVGGIFLAKSARLKSSLVVMESPADPTPRDLKQGECVSVAPDDIDRVEARLHSSIKIEQTPVVAQKTDKVKEGLVELWARTFPAKGAVASHWSGSGLTHRKKASPASIPALVRPLGQPA
jgi:hypothetical protein